MVKIIVSSTRMFFLEIDKKFTFLGFNGCQDFSLKPLFLILSVSVLDMVEVI